MAACSRTELKRTAFKPIPTQTQPQDASDHPFRLEEDVPRHRSRRTAQVQHDSRKHATSFWESSAWLYRTCGL